jgi:hypothetical protein
MKSSFRSLGEPLAGFGIDSFRLVNSQPAFQRAAFGYSLVGLCVAAAVATCLIFYD